MDKMKNIMICILPETAKYEWKEEIFPLLKIQIDNSMTLGWDIKDILLFTNFSYNYHGVKAIKVPDSCFCEYKGTVSKIKTIIYLLEKNILNNNLYWFHDLDAFQLEPFSDKEILNALDSCDLGLTDYGKTTINEGRDKRWSTGTLFFNSNCLDIFRQWKIWCDKYQCNEEVALLDLFKQPKFDYIKKRVKRLNVTWNLGTRKRDIKVCYEIADKPIRVLHFHPFDKRILNLEPSDNIGVCMYGKNRLKKPLMSKKLIEIFNHHGII